MRFPPKLGRSPRASSMLFKVKVRFYGVRGSTPLRALHRALRRKHRLRRAAPRDGTVVILDGGTGLRELGKSLMSEGYKKPLYMLLTHLHWDHIMGIPFFGPLWQKDTHVMIHPLANEAQQFAGRQRALFDGIHFPVRAADVPARVDFLEEVGSTWRIGSATIHRILLNHPGGAQGSASTTTTGRASRISPTTSSRLRRSGHDARSARALRENVDLMIHDAQYVESEMPAKRGWGHSTLEDVVRLAHKAATPHLVLFHHDPERDDDAVDAMQVRANEWLHARSLGARRPSAPPRARGACSISRIAVRHRFRSGPASEAQPVSRRLPEMDIAEAAKLAETFVGKYLDEKGFFRRTADPKDFTIKLRSCSRDPTARRSASRSTATVISA